MKWILTDTGYSRMIDARIKEISHGTRCVSIIIIIIIIMVTSIIISLQLLTASIEIQDKLQDRIRYCRMQMQIYQAEQAQVCTTLEHSSCLQCVDGILEQLVRHSSHELGVRSLRYSSRLCCSIHAS